MTPDPLPTTGTSAAPGPTAPQPGDGRPEGILTARQVYALLTPRAWTVLGLAGAGLASAVWTVWRPLADLTVTLPLMVLAVALPAIVAVDVVSRRIPRVLTRLPGVAVCVAAALVVLDALRHDTLGSLAPAAAVVSAVGAYFLVLVVLGGLGAGDMHLVIIAAVPIGLHDPLSALVVLAFAPPVLMIVPAVVLSALKVRHMPFGPAIAVAIAAYLVAPGLIDPIAVAI